MSRQRIPPRYDTGFVAELLRRVADLEAAAYVRGQDVEINAVPTARSGNRVPRLILRAPNGERWEVVVANTTGALSTNLVS
jgi:hypothetical protein